MSFFTSTFSPHSLLLDLVVFQVTLIARGDVPLSIVMTVCTTLGAVILTPLLTKFLAGTYVPVDAVKLSISTLQVTWCYLLPNVLVLLLTWLFNFLILGSLISFLGF